MDADLEAAEIVLAQKLASGEPTIRKRALKALHDWIRNESKSLKFNEQSMERLCKGLHYVMWMQDKMLLQEELADSIGNLVNFFGDETQSVLFVKQLFVVLSNEWSRIDRWRMDKFLMLIRRVVRCVFARLRSKNWLSSIVDIYMDAFKETVISIDKSFSEGLKFHFASVYLDELDNAGGLSAEEVSKFLKPYADLLSKNVITKYLFDSVLEEVFVSILHLYAEEKADAEERAGDEEMLEETSSKNDSLKFDYDGIAKMLFDVGKQPELKSDRRKRLYAIVKKFKAASAGEDPFVQITEDDLKIKTKIGKTDMANAVSRVVNEHAKVIAAKLKAKKKLKASKRKAQEHPSVDATGAADEVSGQKVKSKLKKKRVSKSKVGSLRPRKNKKIVKGSKKIKKH